MEKVNYCRYLSADPIGEHNSPKCDMVGQIKLGGRDFLSPLQPEYIKHVCNHDDVARKVCEHFLALKREEGIARRVTELTEELTSLARRLSPYVAKPAQELTEQ